MLFFSPHHLKILQYNLHCDDLASTLLLRSVFIGKAQEAFISLSVPDRNDYMATKKSGVYKLQGQRNWKKGDKQMHVEVARELTGFYINKHEVNTPADSLFLNELTLSHKRATKDFSSGQYCPVLHSTST